GRAPRPPVAAAQRRGGLGRAALALPDPPRDDLQAAGGAPGHPVALLLRGHPGAGLPARQALGRGPGRARRTRAVRPGRPLPAGMGGAAAPVGVLDEGFPFRLTTGRRLADYSTGVQTRGCSSPLRRGELLDISPEDAAALDIADGETVRVSSRRGSVLVPASI